MRLSAVRIHLTRNYLVSHSSCLPSIDVRRDIEADTPHIANCESANAKMQEREEQAGASYDPCKTLGMEIHSLHEEQKRENSQCLARHSFPSVVDLAVPNQQALSPLDCRDAAKKCHVNQNTEAAQV